MAHSLLHAQRVDTHLNSVDASGDARSESVALLAPKDAVDARVASLGKARMVVGWCSYDAFFEDVQDDATDAAAAQNKHNRKLNEGKRTVRTADGKEHEVRGFALDVPGEEGGRRALVTAPLPIVQCTAQSTVIELAPRAMPAGVTFEVSFRAAEGGGDAWTEAEPVPRRRFKRKRRRTRRPLVCRSRPRAERQGAVVAAPTPFVLRERRREGGCVWVRVWVQGGLW